MPIHLDDKSGYSGNFRPRPPKFNWGGLIVILFMILAILGMALYQSFK